jgi:hypothetical protein
MGREVFALVDASAREQAAMVIDESQKRRLALLAREPAMGRGVVLPKLANILDLPAAHWTRWILARADKEPTPDAEPIGRPWRGAG